MKRKNIKQILTLTTFTLGVGAGCGEADTAKPEESEPGTTASQLASLSATGRTALDQPVLIQADDFEFQGQEVVAVQSPDLVYHLTLHPAEAMELLNDVSPIDLDDVSIDDRGRVIVKDAEFAAKVRAGVNTNIICGYGCGPVKSTK